MRAPWQEPPAPSFVDVLYEDDDIVSKRGCEHSL